MLMSSLVEWVTWAPNTLSPLGHPAPHWGGVTYRGWWEQSGVPEKDVLVTWGWCLGRSTCTVC